MSSKVHTLVFCVTSTLTVIAVWLLTLFASMFLIILVLLKVFGAQVSAPGEYGLMVGGWAMFLGFLISPLSLLPSYKLSLKFAKWLEETRGVKIENPKKLFWAALGILLLPIILLIIWGAIASASPPKPEKPPKPPKIVHRRCKPFKYKQNKKASPQGPLFCSLQPQPTCWRGERRGGRSFARPSFLGADSEFFSRRI